MPASCSMLSAQCHCSKQTSVRPLHGSIDRELDNQMHSNLVNLGTKKEQTRLLHQFWACLIYHSIEVGAVQGSRTPVVEADHTSAVTKLASLGIVEERNTGSGHWQLTRHGVQKEVVPLTVLQTSRRLTEPRDVTDTERSEFELLQTMEADGWEWCRLNPKKMLAAYTVGSSKLWGTKSRHVPGREYLLCLLNLPDICAKHPAITSVPHGRDARTYAMLLEGTPAPDLLDGVFVKQANAEVFVKQANAGLAPEVVVKEANAKVPNLDSISNT
eukprot:6464731-Amphidinium_carterae.2